jgi:hypothetical protein
MHSLQQRAPFCTTPANKCPPCNSIPNLDNHTMRHESTQQTHFPQPHHQEGVCLCTSATVANASRAKYEPTAPQPASANDTNTPATRTARQRHKPCTSRPTVTQKVAKVLLVTPGDSGVTPAPSSHHPTQTHASSCHTQHNTNTQLHAKNQTQKRSTNTPQPSMNKTARAAQPPRHPHQTAQKCTAAPFKTMNTHTEYCSTAEPKRRAKKLKTQRARGHTPATHPTPSPPHMHAHRPPTRAPTSTQRCACAAMLAQRVQPAASPCSPCAAGSALGVGEGAAVGGKCRTAAGPSPHAPVHGFDGPQCSCPACAAAVRHMRHDPMSHGRRQPCGCSACSQLPRRHRHVPLAGS